MHRRPVLTSRPRPQVRLAFLNGLAAMSPSSTTPSPRILPPPRLRAPPPPRPCTAPPPSPWTCRPSQAASSPKPSLSAAPPLRPRATPS
ncbi:hypothetical protein PF004_g32388, partial [Phytophthora fragariae]